MSTLDRGAIFGQGKKRDGIKDWMSRCQEWKNGTKLSACNVMAMAHIVFERLRDAIQALTPQVLEWFLQWEGWHAASKHHNKFSAGTRLLDRSESTLARLTKGVVRLVIQLPRLPTSSLRLDSRCPFCPSCVAAQIVSFRGTHTFFAHLVSVFWHMHRFVNVVAGPGGKRRMNPNGEK